MVSELSKLTQLLATPSRWPVPILLGLIVGLFISAFFMTSWVTPTHIKISSLSDFLFSSTPASHASTPQHLAAPFKKPVESSHDSTDANTFTELESVTHQADLHLQDAVVAREVDLPQVLADEIVRHVENATDTLISSDLSSSSFIRESRHAGKEIFSMLSPRADTIDKVHHEFSSSANLINPQCDISIGNWVEDATYPHYDMGSCPFVDTGFSCHQNGRPDTRYTKWRWAPRDCKVPRFNGTGMLERLKGKRLVFVGDSLNRNQWESMLCMLRESLSDKSRIVQMKGNRIFKLPGGYVFKFLDYDCQVEYYTSPYLMEWQEVSNLTRYIIKLDKIDKSEKRWRNADVLVFNTGHWWTPGKIGDGENCFQEGNEVYAKLDVMVAYNKALSTWAKWVDRYINPQNTTVFFQGYSPVHYRGGQWNSGGKCQNETEPIYKESYLTAYPDKMQAFERVVQGMRVPVHVSNITRLSDYRKDGHPATFAHPPHHVITPQDCSHWCLPGLPDIWNELLSFALFKTSVYTRIN